MVKNETYLKIKTLQFDNGGEYLDANFKRYCDENGVKIKKTVPRNP